MIIATYRLRAALLTFAAIGYQAHSLSAGGTFDPVNYFSYFTIDSNIIASLLLLAGAVGVTGPRHDLLRGGAVVYMTVTGVVFTLLLSGTDVDTAIPWGNTVVHEAGPLVVLADWLIAAPARGISTSRSVLWLSFPLAWIGYTLIRGGATGRYPYPFLNPMNGGYATVAVYCVVILVFMLLLCVAFSWVPRRRSPAR